MNITFKDVYFNQPNIGLTFKSAPELLRRFGVVCALLSCTNHDKGIYKVEAGVRRFFLPYLTQKYINCLLLMALLYFQ